MLLSHEHNVRDSGGDRSESGAHTNRLTPGRATPTAIVRSVAATRYTAPPRRPTPRQAGLAEDAGDVEIIDVLWRAADDDDRNLAGGRLGGQFLENGESIDAGQDQIQHDGVRLLHFDPRSASKPLPAWCTSNPANASACRYIRRSGTSSSTMSNVRLAIAQRQRILGVTKAEPLGARVVAYHGFVRAHAGVVASPKKCG